MRQVRHRAPSTRCARAQEKDEFVDNILADVAALGVAYQRVTHTSDYFPQLADLAERLLRAGHLYADDTPLEQMRAVRPPAPPRRGARRPAPCCCGPRGRGSGWGPGALQGAWEGPFVCPGMRHSTPGGLLMYFQRCTSDKCDV